MHVLHLETVSRHVYDLIVIHVRPRIHDNILSYLKTVEKENSYSDVKHVGPYH